MRKLAYVTSLLAALLLAGCGGSGVGFAVPPDDSATVVTVDVTTSSSTLPSDPGQEVDVIVELLDLNNEPVSGVAVTMAVDSGILTIINPVSDENGLVFALLDSGGDPTNRTITIGAGAGNVAGTAVVNVVGTTITLTGAATLVRGNSATYAVALTDAAGGGIAGETVDVSSLLGNTLSAASLSTDALGLAAFDVTATVEGVDTLTATALGMDTTLLLTVTAVVASNKSQTLYTASSSTGADSGATINASVQSSNSTSDLLVSIMPASSITDADSGQRRMEFVVQVRDAQGHGVESLAIQTGALSDAGADSWMQSFTAASCSMADVFEATESGSWVDVSIVKNASAVSNAETASLRLPVSALDQADHCNSL